METLKEGSQSIGNHTRAKVVKNKVAPPFREAEFDIVYGEGISRYGELVDIGVKLDIIDKAGAWFTCCGTRLQGKEAVKDFLKNNPEACDEVEKQIRENAYKLMSKSKEAPGIPVRKAIDVSADDFDEG